MTVKDWLDRAHLGDVAVITKSYMEIYLTRSTSGVWVQYYSPIVIGVEQELSSVLSSWGKVEVGDYIISHEQDCRHADTMTCRYCEMTFQDLFDKRVPVIVCEESEFHMDYDTRTIYVVGHPSLTNFGGYPLDKYAHCDTANCDWIDSEHIVGCMTFKDLLDSGVKFLVIAGNGNTHYYQEENGIIYSWVEERDGRVWGVRTGRAQGFSIFDYKLTSIPNADWIEPLDLRVWASEELIKLESTACQCPLLTIMQTGCTCGGQ